jgi:hypothetical protein
MVVLRCLSKTVSLHKLIELKLKLCESNYSFSRN